MYSYFLYRDRQVLEGDLRRLQILTSDELSLEQDLLGPFNKLDDALKIAESEIESIVAKVLERLRIEKPRKFATFPASSQAPEE